MAAHRRQELAPAPAARRQRAPEAAALEAEPALEERRLAEELRRHAGDRASLVALLRRLPAHRHLTARLLLVREVGADAAREIVGEALGPGAASLALVPGPPPPDGVEDAEAARRFARASRIRDIVVRALSPGARPDPGALLSLLSAADRPVALAAIQLLRDAHLPERGASAFAVLDQISAGGASRFASHRQDGGPGVPHVEVALTAALSRVGLFATPSPVEAPAVSSAPAQVARLAGEEQAGGVPVSGDLGLGLPQLGSLDGLLRVGGTFNQLIEATLGKWSRSLGVPLEQEVPGGSDALGAEVADGVRREQAAPRPGKIAAHAVRVAREGSRGSLPFQAEMEARFGRDFSSVDCYFGAPAKLACQLVGAKAFTVKNVIVFGSDAPAMEVVAHELTHVVQQGGDEQRLGAVPDELDVSRPEDAAEHEAEHIGGARAEAASAVGVRGFGLHRLVDVAGTQPNVLEQIVTGVVPAGYSQKFDQFKQVGDGVHQSEEDVKGVIDSATAFPVNDVKSLFSADSYKFLDPKSLFESMKPEGDNFVEKIVSVVLKVCEKVLGVLDGLLGVVNKVLAIVEKVLDVLDKTSKALNTIYKVLMIIAAALAATMFGGPLAAVLRTIATFCKNAANTIDSISQVIHGFVDPIKEIVDKINKIKEKVEKVAQICKIIKLACDVFDWLTAKTADSRSKAAQNILQNIGSVTDFLGSLNQGKFVQFAEKFWEKALPVVQKGLENEVHDPDAGKASAAHASGGKEAHGGKQSDPDEGKGNPGKEQAPEQAPETTGQDAARAHQEFMDEAKAQNEKKTKAPAEKQKLAKENDEKASVAQTQQQATAAAAQNQGGEDGPSAADVATPDGANNDLSAQDAPKHSEVKGAKGSTASIASWALDTASQFIPNPQIKALVGGLAKGYPKNAGEVFSYLQQVIEYQGTADGLKQDGDKRVQESEALKTNADNSEKTAEETKKVSGEQRESATRDQQANTQGIHFMQTLQQKAKEVQQKIQQKIEEALGAKEESGKAGNDASDKMSSTQSEGASAGSTGSGAMAIVKKVTTAILKKLLAKLMEKINIGGLLKKLIPGKLGNIFGMIMNFVGFATDAKSKGAAKQGEHAQAEGIFGMAKGLDIQGILGTKTNDGQADQIIATAKQTRATAQKTAQQGKALIEKSSQLKESLKQEQAQVEAKVAARLAPFRPLRNRVEPAPHIEGTPAGASTAPKGGAAAHGGAGDAAAHGPEQQGQGGKGGKGGHGAAGAKGGGGAQGHGAKGQGAQGGAAAHGAEAAHGGAAHGGGAQGGAAHDGAAHGGAAHDGAAHGRAAHAGGGAQHASGGAQHTTAHAQGGEPAQGGHADAGHQSAHDHAAHDQQGAQHGGQDQHGHDAQGAQHGAKDQHGADGAAHGHDQPGQHGADSGGGAAAHGAQGGPAAAHGAQGGPGAAHGAQGGATAHGGGAGAAAQHGGAGAPAPASSAAQGATSATGGAATAAHGGGTESAGGGGAGAAPAGAAGGGADADFATVRDEHPEEKTLADKVEQRTKDPSPPPSVAQQEQEIQTPATAAIAAKKDEHQKALDGVKSKVPAAAAMLKNIKPLPSVKEPGPEVLPKPLPTDNFGTGEKQSITDGDVGHVTGWLQNQPQGTLLKPEAGNTGPAPQLAPAHVAPSQSKAPAHLPNKPATAVPSVTAPQLPVATVHAESASVKAEAGALMSKEIVSQRYAKHKAAADGIAAQYKASEESTVKPIQQQIVAAQAQQQQETDRAFADRAKTIDTARDDWGKKRDDAVHGAEKDVQSAHETKVKEASAALGKAHTDTNAKLRQGEKDAKGLEDQTHKKVTAEAEAAKTKSKGLWGWVRDTVSQFASAMLQKITGLWAQAKGAMTSLLQTVKQQATAMLTQARQVVVDGLSKLGAEITRLFEAGKAKLAQAAAAAKSFITRAITAAVAAVKKLAQTIGQQITKLLQGAWAAVKKLVADITAKLKAEWAKFKDFLKEVIAAPGAFLTALARAEVRAEHKLAEEQAKDKQPEPAPTTTPATTPAKSPAPPTGGATTNEPAAANGPAPAAPKGAPAAATGGALAEPLRHFGQLAPSEQPAAYKQLGPQLDAASKKDAADFQKSVPEFHARLAGEKDVAAHAPTPARSVNLPGLTSAAAPKSEPAAAAKQALPATGPTTPPAAPVVSFTDETKVDQRAVQVGQALNTVSPHAPAMNTSPGPAPTFPHQGAADPARVDQYGAQIDASVAQGAGDDRKQLALGGDVHRVHTVAIDEKFSVAAFRAATVPHLPPVKAMEDFEAAHLDPEVKAAFDQKARAEMAGPLAGAERTVEQAAQTGEQLRAAELEKATKEHDARLERAQKDQAQHVTEARTQIQSERDKKLAEHDRAVEAAHAELGKERGERRKAIDRRAREDERKVEEAYDAAHRDARDQVEKGESEAQQKKEGAKKNAKEQSWWEKTAGWAKDMISRVESDIHQLFDKVRGAVNRILDAVVKKAHAIIDAGVKFVCDQIHDFGEKVKSIAQKLLGNVLPGLTGLFCRWVDQKVAEAQAKVRQVGENLKREVTQFVADLKRRIDEKLTALEQSITKGLEAYSKALDLTWKDWVKLAFEAYLRSIGVDPAAAYKFIGAAEAVLKRVLTFLKPFGEALLKILQLANPMGIPMLLMSQAWLKLPDDVKVKLIDAVLDFAVAAVEKVPNLVMFGNFLWPIVKPGIIGFLKGVRSQAFEVKVKVSNRIAKILGGQSLGFQIGFVKGFLSGVWKGISDPFVDAWNILKLGIQVDEWILSTGLSIAEKALGLKKPSEKQKQSILKQVGAKFHQLYDETVPVVKDIAANFFSAAKEFFSSAGSGGISGLIAKFKGFWAEMQAKIQAVGGDIAKKLTHFFEEDSADGELGETVGEFTGAVTFQVVLGIVTAGTFQEAQGAMKALWVIGKVLDWESEAAKIWHAKALGALEKVGEALLKVGEKLEKLFESGGAAMKRILGGLKTIGAKFVKWAKDLFKMIEKAWEVEKNEKNTPLGKRIKEKAGEELKDKAKEKAGEVAKEEAKEYWEHQKEAHEKK